MFDAAHIAGLIAGGAHPNPVPPRRRRDLHHPQDAPRAPWWLHPAHARSTREASTRRSSRVCRAGPLEHVIAAKAVAFREAATPEFRDYAARSSPTPQALAEALAESRVPSRQRRHRQPPAARRPAQLRRRAHRQGCPGGARRRRRHASTRTPIPDDPRSPFVTSGVRIGTPAVTTQGMGPRRDGRSSPS